MPKWLDWLPLFVFPLAFFYMAGEVQTIAWINPFFADKLKILTEYNTLIFSIELPSRQIWHLTMGQLIIFLGVLILYIELFKSTQTSQVSIIDHTLSMFVFIGYFGLFLSKGWANNDVFLILMAMSFLDVIAGFTITIATARRDFSLGGLGGG